ncbi:NB-ARC domain-containing protein [Kitasatospora sp. NPDC088134]|uniref:NB-ARC domain-containing protein n=1 Tax=Kitasatospora sp. NPDC088134 TaxID=3364071 RepID=UPI00382EE822
MNGRAEPEHPEPPSVRSSVSNSLSGVAHGPVLQAGSVHGGINLTTYHAAGPAAPEYRRPDQVPRPPRRFVDRVDPLAEFDAAFVDAESGRGCPIGVFSGMPGIGKSAAASEWADRNRDRFPGGQFYVDFGKLGEGAGRDVSEALAMCLRGLGVHETFLPTGLADRTALYRTMSADRRMLLVLDDVSSPAHVTALLPHGAGSAVLATSNRRLGELAGDGAVLLELDVLDRPSALELLAARCGQPQLAAEPAAADLVDLCGGLPLAIRLCAARLATHRRLTVGALVTELADEKARLNIIAASSGPEERSMSAALELVCRDLPDPAAAIYRLLGLLPGRAFDTGLVAVAAGREPAAVQEALDTLEAASLLVRGADDRYTMHSLVRLHARESARRADPPGTEEQVVRRATGHYLALTLRADLAVRTDRLRFTDPAEILGTGPDAPGPETPAAGPFAAADRPGEAALAWLEAERGNILAVLRAAYGFGLHRPVWQLAEVFTVLFLHHRHLADWRESLELGADAAAEDGAAAAEARLRSLLSRPLLDLGRDAEARAQLETADRLAVETGHLVLQASVQEFLGRYWDRHDPARAIDAYRTSLDLNHRAGEARGAALARYFLGCAQDAAGDRAAALAELTAARTELLTRGDARMAARALADQGRVRARLGDRPAAAADLRQAAAELAKQQATYYEAQALEDLAPLLDDPAEAEECLRRALAIYEEGGSPKAAEVRARLAAG